MPITVNELLEEARLRLNGSVQWGRRIPENRPGVYVVSASSDPSTCSSGCYGSAPISESAVSKWLDRVPTLRVGGERPSPELLIAEMSKYWLPGETIVYVGKAGTSLRTRVRQFYSTTLGNRSPHAGGSWIKTLSILDELTVHYALADDPEDTEKLLLYRFGVVCSRQSDCHPMPFGNLETYLRTGNGYQLIGKQHRVRNWKLP